MAKRAKQGPTHSDEPISNPYSKQVESLLCEWIDELPFTIQFLCTYVATFSEKA